MISLDDQTVVKDLAALDGTGGNAYAPFLLGALFALSAGVAYEKLRQVIQRVPHDGLVTVKVTPWRDGQDTGQVITRVLTPDDNPTVVAPLNATGSLFQIKVELSAFDAPASLGAGSITAIQRRRQR